MGYTWEMPPHWYLERAWVLGTGFGTSEAHEERLAAALTGAAPAPRRSAGLPALF